MIEVVYADSLSQEDLFNIVGEIPFWLDEMDPRPARDQLDDHYQHGGGWMPIQGFTLRKKDMALCYPGDPDMMPLAYCALRDERIVFYPHAWVMVLQLDDTFEVCRMD